MRTTELSSHLTTTEIKRRMLSSKSRQQFQRWQVIFILSQKRFRAEETAELVGVSKGTVYQWVHSYNHQGPKAFELQGRGGRRRTLLSLPEEKRLLEEIRVIAEQGKAVIARTIKDKVEARLGRKVSKDYTYDLLHRHGWRKISPRPRHPKSDFSTQEEFKKNFQPWWQPPPRASSQKMRDL